MPVSIYSVLIQHKLIWVVLFSILILEKTFTTRQYLALIAVCSGCMLTKFSINEIVITELGLLLIVVQGICSSLSSIWIEKMMKVAERPIVSENPRENQLYWFLADSFQMYLFAIPIYIAGVYTSQTPGVEKNTLPYEVFLIIVFLSVLNGMSLGAVFVYHSSIVRSIVSAVVIVLLSIAHGIFSVYTISGIGLVLLGVIGWSRFAK
jgi:drug/metabolite transporter (DMT)-like permease|tara:strand:+ start:533 stop:1153 length:621 start_codon:yes stop_codon:yes gene_type:complete